MNYVKHNPHRGNSRRGIVIGVIVIGGNGRRGMVVGGKRCFIQELFCNMLSLSLKV